MFAGRLWWSACLSLRLTWLPQTLLGRAPQGAFAQGTSALGNTCADQYPGGGRNFEHTSQRCALINPSSFLAATSFYFLTGLAALRSRTRTLASSSTPSLSYASSIVRVHVTCDPALVFRDFVTKKSPLLWYRRTSIYNLVNVSS